MKAGRHVLYRFYGQGGELLYVGITGNLGNRLGQHRDSKPWWSEVVGATFEHHPDRASVLSAERAAIAAERPLHNVKHNRGPARQVAQAWTAEDMPDCCHEGCMRGEAYDATIYFPHEWVDGVGQYVCRRGHRWSCGWGHKGSGTANMPPLREPVRVAREFTFPLDLA